MNKQTLISTTGTLGVATAGTPVVSVFGRVHWHFYTQNSHYFAQIQLGYGPELGFDPAGRLAGE